MKMNDLLDSKRSQCLWRLVVKKRIEDDIRKNKKGLIDRNIKDITSMLTLGLHISRDDLGDYLLGRRSLQGKIERYMACFDPHHDERKKLATQVKKLTREIRRLHYKPTGNISQLREVEAAIRDAGALKDSLEAQINAFPKSNGIDCTRTFGALTEEVLQDMGLAEHKHGHLRLSRKGQRIYDLQGVYIAEMQHYKQIRRPISDSWLLERWDHLKSLL